MIYQSEKSLSDLGDKASDSDKATVQAAIDKLKETLKGENIEAIKADTEALEKAFYPIAEKMYREEAAKNGGSSAGDPGAGAGPEQGPDGNTYYSSDFEDKSGN